MAAPSRLHLSRTAKLLGDLLHCRTYSSMQNTWLVRAQSTTTVVTSNKNANEKTTHAKVQKISKAMQVYLEKAAEHESMLVEHRAEFELGRRYLANMMGADPENFTQDEIDQAISYLLPSGLFDRRARPMMKPPEFIFPKKKAAEFDTSGRPKHYLFYTGLPHYFDLMHSIGERIVKAGGKTKDVHVSGSDNSSETPSNYLDATQWLSKADLVSMIIEEISDEEYNRFLRLMTKLSDLSHSEDDRSFIMKYRVPIVGGGENKRLPKVLTDELSGRQFAKAEGKRKTSVANITVWENGSGKVNINGMGFDYFPGISEREQIMSPLSFVNKLNHVDIEGSVECRGKAVNDKNSSKSSEAGAVRLALSKALAAFEEPDVQERMRQAGLLTRDPRMRERKKAGQRGAREKKTWKKR